VAGRLAYLTQPESGGAPDWLTEFGIEFCPKESTMKRPITHRQLAAKSFEPIAEFVNLNAKPTVKERHEQQLENIAVISRLAIHMLGKQKSELVQSLRNLGSVHTADDMFRSIVEGRESAEALVRLIESAEMRIAIALASLVDQNWTVRSVAH
jgi:phosphatidylserine/phosphatidylglycerophosphate/cardiolipin synthase-like enzyme